MRAAKKMPALEVRREELALHGGRGRLVVVADTHSAPHPRAEERIRALRPDAILHGGDIGDLVVLDMLGRIAPTVAVRGNIDGRAPGVPDVVRIALTMDGAELATILLLHIAVAGPRLRADARRLAEREQAELVVCGHSHVPFAATDRGLTVFNPGSIGPRRFSLPIVFGVIDVTATGIDLRHVSCETGQAWSPAASSRSSGPS